MTRRLFAVALAAFAVIQWLPAEATGGAAPSGRKAGSTSAITSKDSGLSQHCAVRGARSFGGFRHFGSTSLDGLSFLIVDASPAEAQVFLDDRSLGSAAELVARALPLAQGRHTVWVVAPGFTPWSAHFVATGFSTHLRITLFPE